MKKRKTTIKTKKPRPTPRSSAVAAAPLKMIRLVVQLKDIPINRRVIEALREAAKATAVQGPNGAIKMEDVQILSIHTAQPRQNAEDSRDK